ncbi:hypothetical protein Val02_29630 [Virgisporangium aliadipatigenens]|uniref:Membrane alanyl aminopeptidase n=1 Tax=Virgisporangium aliadipatigenens TaxID=741659 RepID=A0A8J4DR84_9ACTN|nr:M1 family metallopeptidase [Virgisporangium aliadipatigenens]GIJ46077.1 hypothetical protein Val02_29630 [Virgisporangium aliadipatigenens]
MRTKSLLAAVCAAVLAVSTASAAEAAGGAFSPGAPGAGDPYFPLDGNGGYDVGDYLLDLAYAPDTDTLTGAVTIKATATQDLSAFNLDFDGLTVRSVTVDGRAAGWQRADGELTVTPARGLPRGRAFTTVVRYDGVPAPIDDPTIGTSGVVHTDDGMIVAGEPHAAATWFPVNDHPTDKATYTVRMSVPRGLTAVSNGALKGSATRDGRTTWTWRADEPMAPYLATVAVGRFDLRAYEADGLKWWDAVDPRLTAPAAVPHGGSRLAWSGDGIPAYRRLTRVVDVPATGARLSFWNIMNTPDTGFFFVEAHTVGAADWTTLEESSGLGRPWAGSLCRHFDTHPFLAHYVRAGADGECEATGTTGVWRGLSSYNSGREWSEWSYDLAAYAGKRVELSLSYVSTKPVESWEDDTERPGVFLDDLVLSTDAGSTSFETGLEGWSAGTAPGSPADARSWTAAAADTIPAGGATIGQALSRQPEMVRFLASNFGPYPFRTAGAIVDQSDLGFSLETQTRPIYSTQVFWTRSGAQSVVLHELAHQWFGDSVSVRGWRDTWLNEGFATYAQWLWEEHEGGRSPQETFDSAYAALPEDSGIWDFALAEPGREAMLWNSVYLRGAMTLQVLRGNVGDEPFFRIMRTWTSEFAGRNATTTDFVAVAERVAGRPLGGVLDPWLFRAGRPAV